MCIVDPETGKLLCVKPKRDRVANERDAKIESEKLAENSDGQITPAERHKLNYE